MAENDKPVVGEYDRHYVLYRGDTDALQEAERLLRKADQKLSRVRDTARPQYLYAEPDDRTPRQNEQVALYDLLGAMMADLAAMRGMLVTTAAAHQRLSERNYGQGVGKRWDDQIAENRRRNLEEYGEARPDFPE